MDTSAKSAMPGREILDMTGRKVVVPKVINSVFAASFYGYTMLGSLAPELIAATPMPPRPCDRRFLHPHLHDLPVIEKITDRDAIAKLKPDIVLVWADKEQPYHKKSEDVLNALNIPFVYVIIGNLGDVPDFPDAYRFLGELLGREERAAQLADYCGRALAEIAAVVDLVSPRLRPGVYYAEGDDGLLTEFDDSLHAHLLKLTGDVNVIRGHMTEHKGLELITLAQIVECNPDVIIAWNRSCVKNMLIDPAWSKIRAVRDQRVYAIPNVPFNWFDRPPCFMRILGLKWLASLLYPNEYAVDLVKETQDFYALFLGVNITRQEAQKVLDQDYS